MQGFPKQRVLELDGGEITFKLEEEAEMDVPPAKEENPTERRRGPALVAKGPQWEGVVEHPASRGDVDEYPHSELESLYRRALQG